MALLASPTVQMDGPAALRALARALAHLGDFDRFVSGLQTALDRSALFARTTLALDRGLAAGAENFPPGVMSLPLAGGGENFGSLHATPGGETRQFGAEDLHLLAGLADFLAAALAASAQLQAAGQSRELLRFLLNQAPVGIAAYGANRQPLVANELARRWIGETALPFEDLEKGAASFHLRSGGKLIYGEARHAGPDGSWMVVLQDLTPDQARLLELMRRETYRALAQRGKFGFALVEGGDMHHGVLRRLPELRAALMLGETAGPYDAHRVGLVFSEVNGLALRARLRKLRHVFAGVEGLRVGYAEMGRNGTTPEAVLEAALHIAAPYDAAVRPSVLVHDENPAVTDSLALLLGRDFNVVQSSESGRTRDLLGREMFEGFVTELESRTGPDGAELMRIARAQLPGIRPFFLTARHATQDWPGETGKEDSVVFEKPFDVAVVTQAMREKMAD
jgi:PAS domain-containing protein